MKSMLLVGCGPMSVEYAKVLRALNITPIVVGRGSSSAEKFTLETDFAVSQGGIEKWLNDQNTPLPEAAIIAVGEKWVGSTAIMLMNKGIRKLLVEKPGGFDIEDIRNVESKAKETNSEVFVGYNRRFYSSVAAAKKIIAEDGGVKSFNFEFTEWSHVISPLQKEEGVKQQWFLSNSTHVIDLAFHLGGKPAQLSAYTAGGSDWHPVASVFAGAGISDSGALFSYQANWEAPGRWSAEILTSKHRLIFRPLEKLQIQKIGSVAIDLVEIDDSLDQEFKPGLYNQVNAFIQGDSSILPTIQEQVAMLDVYKEIRGD